MFKVVFTMQLSQGIQMDPIEQASHAPDHNMLSVVKRQRIQDFFFHKITLSFSLLVLFALMGIIISLLINAWPALAKFGFQFVWRVEWDIVNDEFGAAIAIFGTLVSALIALLIAVPLSFGIALFLTETCPTSLRRPLGTAIELLAAVPSIIYGMFGLFIFAPLFAEYGQPALQSTLGQMPIIGTLFQPIEGRGPIDEAYAKMEEIKQAKGTFTRLVEQGKQAEARAFAQQYSTELAMATTSGAVYKRLGELSKQERAIKASANMDTAQKDEAIKRIEQAKIKLARMLTQASDRAAETKPQ